VLVLGSDAVAVLVELAGVHVLVAVLEVGSNVRLLFLTVHFLVSVNLLQPRVPYNLVQSQSLTWLYLQHTFYELNTLTGEAVLFILHFEFIIGDLGLQPLLEPLLAFVCLFVEVNPVVLVIVKG
jgi:hypothetical protein